MGVLYNSSLSESDFFIAAPDGLIATKNEIKNYVMTVHGVTIFLRFLRDIIIDYNKKKCTNSFLIYDSGCGSDLWNP